MSDGFPLKAYRFRVRNPTHPDRWLQARRQTVSDPMEIEAIQRRYRRFRWMHRSTYLLLALAVLGGTMVGDEVSWLELTLIAAAVGASFAVRSVADALMKRTRRRTPP